MLSFFFAALVAQAWPGPYVDPNVGKINDWFFENLNLPENTEEITLSSRVCNLKLSQLGLFVAIRVHNFEYGRSQMADLHNDGMYHNHLSVEVNTPNELRFTSTTDWTCRPPDGGCEGPVEIKQFSIKRVSGQFEATIFDSASKPVATCRF